MPREVPSFREDVGASDLLQAAARGELDSLRALLDSGADIEQADAEGRTALSCAISTRQYAVVKELLDRGAIIGDADRPLFDAWLRWLEAEAEDAYGRMYDDAGDTAAAGHYSNAKDYLADAIGLSRRIGKLETTEKLKARLDHIKNVFRSQFR
jgi:hypothetical protein